MALPTRVRFTKRVSSTISTTVTTRVMAVSRLTVTPPRVKPSPVKWFGKGLGLEPKMSRKPFCSIRLTPMVVMSADILEPPRSGL